MNKRHESAFTILDLDHFPNESGDLVEKKMSKAITVIALLGAAVVFILALVLAFLFV